MNVLLVIAAVLCIAWNVYAYITLRTGASCVFCTWALIALIVWLK